MVNNLDNIVKTVPPDIDIVDTLTDTLSDLKTQLDDLDDDDNNSQSQSQSDSSSSSTCSSTTVTDCTIDVYESTTYFVTDGSTTSVVSTSTSSDCSTITSCSATPTTVYTTSATSTTSSTTTEDVCSPDTCNGAACAAKRAMATRAPLPPTYPYPELNPEDFFPYLNSTPDDRHSLRQRDVPTAGSGDWSGFYNSLKTQSNSVVMDIFNGVMGTQTAVEYVPFNTAAQNIVIEGLYGCTSVIIVDHRGKILCRSFQYHGLLILIRRDRCLCQSYLGRQCIEGRASRHMAIRRSQPFEVSLRNIPMLCWRFAHGHCSNYLDTYAGNTFTPNAKVYLMVSSEKPVDNTGAVNQDVYPPTIIEGSYPVQSELDAIVNPQPPAKYDDKTQQLSDLIKQKLPGIADPVRWEYRRQTVKAIRQLGAGFGRAAVSTALANTPPSPPRHSANTCTAGTV